MATRANGQGLLGYAQFAQYAAAGAGAAARKAGDAMATIDTAAGNIAELTTPERHLARIQAGIPAPLIQNPRPDL